MSDDRIAEIRARHEAPGAMLPVEALGRAIADRAMLLAEVERLRTQIVLLEATGAEASDEIDQLRAALEAKP